MSLSEDIWISGTIVKGTKVIKRMIKKCVTTTTFRELFDHMNQAADIEDVDCHKLTISVSSVDIQTDSCQASAGHEVNSDDPLEVMKLFNSKYIVFRIMDLMPPIPGPTKSAFDIMMKSSVSYVHLPEAKPDRGPGKTFNALIGLMKDTNIGFRASQKSFGEMVIKKLADAIWYLDPQMPKLEQRGLEIPKYFGRATGLNCPQDHKQAIPKIDVDALSIHETSVNEILLTPWINCFSTFKKHLSELAETVTKYKRYLELQRKKCTQQRESTETMRSPEHNFTLRTIEPKDDVSECDPEYSKVYVELAKSECYDPISLLEFEPEERYDRRHWLEKIQLPCPINLYMYHQGSNLGTLSFVWKVPQVKGDRKESLMLKVIHNIHVTLPTYSTRAIRRDFFTRYESVAIKVKPVILRDMYRYLTGDSSASESSTGATIDDRLMQILADCNEPALLLDMRVKGNHSGFTKFNPFWDELNKYLNESVLAVQERRHGEQLYMPAAISLEDVRCEVAKRLPPGSNIPSTEWMRLQFWPKDPTTKRALQHTGRLNVKFAVQQRLLHAQHEDKKFCLHQYQLLKEFAVRWRDQSVLLYLDDKAIVPVGEPDLPVSTGVRAHNPSMVVKQDQKSDSALIALDHDFHLCGIVPSVMLNCEIPSNFQDSFFVGQGVVTLKDKILQPSSPLRHAAEVVSILRTDSSDDDVNLNVPILLNYTDGGPDHRTTYGSVQVAGIAIFLALDLDMYVTARTSPGGSYFNLAERYNALLNFALQHVSSARGKMSATNEMRIKSCGTIKEVRKKVDRFPEMKQDLLSSLKPVHDQLSSRFAHIKLKGVETMVHPAASEEYINDIFELVHTIDDGIDSSKMTKADLAKCERLMDFMSRHCQKKHYIFQIKKCTPENAATCSFCTLFPPRLPVELFEQLHFVPDPVLSEDKTQFLPYDDVYGTNTTDRDRPSAASAIESDVDRANKALFSNTKVRGIINCGECHKPRCIFSNLKLKKVEEDAIERVREGGTYVCGSPLFSTDSRYVNMVVREANSCVKPIEVAYYSGKTASFKPVCFHCGRGEPLAQDEEIQESIRQFTTVRPICIPCKSAGKPIATRGMKNVGKRQKTQ